MSDEHRLAEPFILQPDGTDIFERIAGLIRTFADVNHGDEIMVMTGVAFEHEHGPRQAALVIEVAGRRFGFTCDAAKMVIHVLMKMVKDHVCGGRGECVFAGFPSLIEVIGEGIVQSESDFHQSRLQ